MNIDQYFQPYDWEALISPQEFTGEITCNEETYAPKAIRNNISSLRIERDNKYNLQITAKGTFPSFDFNQDSEDSGSKPPVGSIINGGTIVCDADYNGYITLKTCFYTGHTTSYQLSDPPQSSFEASFHAYEINWKSYYDDDTKADALIEWYLNCIQSTTMFCDSSSVKDTVSRNIERAGVHLHSPENTTEHHSRDCLFITYKDTGFLLRKLPDTVGPAWSNNLAIEYRSSYGRIPDKEEREKISELLSFLMGRHLILVGDTSYYKEAVLESNMYHPYSKDTVSECNSNTRELIPVHQYHNECNNFRSYVQQLLPVYLELRDKYSMHYVLERYWLANAMPVGVNLPILAGAIETLMKVWFKGKTSKTKGVYMESKQYQATLDPIIPSLEKAFQYCEYKDKILKKISDSYQIGVNERFFVFLKELDLEYGDAESQSLKARNSFTHGENNQDYHETIQKTKAMFLLLGRILLKLLGYEGLYIDETVLGYPRKELRDKIGQ